MGRWGMIPALMVLGVVLTPGAQVALWQACMPSQLHQACMPSHLQCLGGMIPLVRAPRSPGVSLWWRRRRCEDGDVGIIPASSIVSPQAQHSPSPWSLPGMSTGAVAQKVCPIIRHPISMQL
jgi:hypothetical protein